MVKKSIYLLVIVPILVMTAMFTGCTDTTSSVTNSQADQNIQPKYTYVTKHFKKLLLDKVYSVSAGYYVKIPIYLDPSDKENYVVYGTMKETAEGTAGVRFYVIGPDGVTYVDSGEKVRSYSFSFRPSETGYYYFYLDNSNTLLTNKLPRLTVYVEYDKQVLVRSD